MEGKGEMEQAAFESAVIEGAGGRVRVPERALANPRPTVTRWTNTAMREEVFSV